MNDFENTQDYQNIKMKLLDYLGRQDYSEDKLLEKVCNLKKYYPKTKRYENYTPKNVIYVIDRLKELGFIDEIRFLENMIYTGLRSQYGIRRIEQKMYQRRYKKENIAQVLSDLKDSGEEHDLSRITSLTQRRKETLERKYPDENTYEINNRLFQFIAQKGFTYDDIQKILKELED